MRATRLDRMKELLAWCDGPGGSPDPRLAEVDGALLARFAADRLRFSDIFEPSLSRDASGWHRRRSSYALPDTREDPAGARAFVSGLAERFDPRLGAWFGRTLLRAEDPSVEQLLFGVAWDGPADWRLKLYVQYADAAREAALEAAARLLSLPSLRERFPGRPLHLLGIDVGPAGLGDVKFYFPSDGPLALPGLPPLEKALEIYRLRPGRALPAAPSEIDFPLAENGLAFEEFSRLPGLASLLDGSDPLSELRRAFRVAVRRISVSARSDLSAGPPDKFTAYYVLAETDPP